MVVDWSRTHPCEAKALFLNEPASLFDTAPPEDLSAAIRAQEARLEQIFQNRLDAASASAAPGEAFCRLRFSIIDGPVALIRPYLQSGEPIPAFIDAVAAGARPAWSPKPAPNLSHRPPNNGLVQPDRPHRGRKIELHGEEGFEGMRRAGDLAARTLDFVAPHVRAGVSTLELDSLCDQFMRDHGAVAATIGYKGYRHASCISVNHVATHGIPAADKILKSGDILNIDVTPLLDGWHGDTSRMFTVGEVATRSRRLIQATHEAMWNAIKLVRPGATVGDLGHAMESTARAYGFATVKVFCGHGVGRVFHTAPDVPFYGRPGEGVVLEPKA